MLISVHTHTLTQLEYNVPVCTEMLEQLLHAIIEAVEQVCFEDERETDAYSLD